MGMTFNKEQCSLALDRAIEDQEAGLLKSKQELYEYEHRHVSLWDYISFGSEDYGLYGYEDKICTHETRIQKLKSFKKYIESSTNKEDISLTHSEFNLISDYYNP